MNKLVIPIAIALAMLLFYGFAEVNEAAPGYNKAVVVHPGAKTIIERFDLPAGFKRENYKRGSFAWYLSHLPLRPAGSVVHYYNGAIKPNNHVYAAVIDMDAGKKDLQQCADAVMHLRAEYLFEQKLYKQIHFNFTSGFRADYIKWAEGNRIRVSGNTVSWYAAKDKDYSFAAFKEYLEVVFTYAGTLSLSKELTPVALANMEVGDVFIMGGSPGHCVIVVDVATEVSSGKKIFMIAQSYMPAQEIQLLVNREDAALSPWYNVTAADKVYTPEYTFEKTSLKRFSHH